VALQNRTLTLPLGAKNQTILIFNAILEMEHPSSGNGVEAVVRRNANDSSVTVTGRVTGLGSIQQTIMWFAASPVTRGIGFAGAGLPYPNKDIAYENTPNQGRVDSADGSFSIQLKGIPAGYFSGLGSIYVPPMIEFHSETPAGNKFYSTLWINDTAVPYRWISGSPATLRPEADTEKSTGRAMFYFGREQLPLFDNQEAQLRAKGFPGDMAMKGWSTAEDAKPWAHVSPPS
jgi:hypothetical protein